MSPFDDLKKYEEMYFKEIVDDLVKTYGHSHAQAQSIFDTYKSIVERIDNDLMPEEWSEKLHKALQNGLDVESWHARCDWADELETYDLTKIPTGYDVKNHRKVTKPPRPIYIKKRLYL